MLNDNLIHITSGDYSYIVEDLVNSCVECFSRLGYNTNFELNKLHDKALNLNIGATGLSLEDFRKTNGRLIHYNLEQINPENWLGTSDTHISRLKTGFIWEYCPRNIEWFKMYDITNVCHVPIRYTDSMSTISPNETQDIDVLFYGFETPRRTIILNQLRDLGLNVVTSNVVTPSSQPWSKKVRDEFISRSKVVLNMHAYDTNKIFEILRVSFLLANKKAVVSELEPDTYIEKYVRKSIKYGIFRELASKCLWLVQDDESRHEQEIIGFNTFKQQNYIQSIQDGLIAYYRNRYGT